MTGLIIEGYNDFPLSKLEDVKDAPRHVKYAAEAVGQLVTVMPRGARLSDRGHRRPLIIPAVELRHRKFLDGYPLYQETEADINQFFDQYTIKASTGTLIGPRLVLTAGHSTVKIDIESGNTFFVPNRVAHKLHLARPRVGAQIQVRKGAYFRVGRIREMNAGRQGNDWALLELETEPGITPIAMPGDGDVLDVGPSDSLFTLTCPLGLPLKHSGVVAAEIKGAPQDYSQVLSDFGSGSSGAPLLHHDSSRNQTRLWGIITGDTRFSMNNVVCTRSGRAVDPRAGHHQNHPQPVTLIDKFGPGARG